MSFILDSTKNTGGRESFLPPRQAYSFPILKSNEIIFNLNELGINVTEDELVNPEKNKDQIRRIYEYLTEYCTGTSREEMSQPVFCGLKRLTYPDLHEESIPQINSFRACQKMLQVCGISDFTIKDFMSPNPKRLRKQLSGIINFSKFREERFTLLTELTAERESVLTNFNNAKKQNEELTRKLSLLREQTKEEAEIIAQIESECKTIEVTINELNHKQAELREEINDLKEDNSKLKDTLAARNIQLEESTHTKKKLQGQIVSSPERFRKQIQDVAQSLHTEKQTIRSLERKHRDLQAWTLHVDEGLSLISSAQDCLNDVQVEASKHKNCAAELDTRRQKASNTGDMLQHMELQVQQLTRQTTRAEEKLNLIRKQASERSQDACLQVDQLHMACQTAENMKRDAKERSDKVVSEAMQLERQIETEKQMQEQEIQDMSAVYKRMEKVLLKHLEDLQQACSVTSSSRPAITNAAKSSSTSPPQFETQKENYQNIGTRSNTALTPEATENELRLQSSPFGVKNLLLASGGMRSHNNQKLHCV